MSASAIAIEFADVSLAFDDTPVLEGLSFRVERSETKVLLGEAGAGKSVTLKLAIGLLRPDRGHVDVLGEPVSEMPERDLFGLRRRIGMVFQESALFDSLTVRENVAYRLEEEGRLDEEAIEARVRECLAAVGLEEAIDQLPADISGGMQRRVSIARALATEPEIMLYDSPTAGLDPITATSIMEQIVRLRDLHQVTALLVTHRLQDAYLLATQGWDAKRNALGPAAPEAGRTTFLVLHQHHAVFDGGRKELQANADPYLRRFLQA